MPFKVSVGPPVLAINQGNTFMVSDRDGQISEHSECGVYSNDTRFVSYYKIYSNDKEWSKLSSSLIDYSSARIFLVNQAFLTEEEEIPAESLALTISRSVGHGICEDFEITNYSQKRVRFNLEIAIRSDFADLFEVRWHKFFRRGRVETVWNAEANELHMAYQNGDFHRELVYQILDCKTPTHFANGRIVFELELAPAEVWQSKAHYKLISSKEESGGHCQQDQTFAQLHTHWIEQATKFTSSNEEFYRLYRQSVDDTGGLRFYDQKLGTDMWIPAAGVPWYVTIFGRDSLIVSLQNMIVNSRLAIGTLKELSSLQAQEIDEFSDAQPGKIPHELRFGELAHVKKVPNPNYGTADATPLFLTVLHETWRWNGDLELLKTYRDNALAALEWIDKYGDLDGDGYQEFQTRSEVGFENQCWKDSPNSIMYPDGSNVAQPKAVCELQGYVFDAWMRSAEVFDALGELDSAKHLRDKAAKLKAQFERDFWCEDIGFYALALDKDKQPVKSLASNAGHLLWSGICSREHAELVATKLFQPGFWSGWGIRTLPSGHPAYNPHSYHNGSVWPHDNALIALGCKRYGFTDRVAAIARDISGAAMYFASNRLPELYAGVAKVPGNFPVQYSQANVPQAWAAGSAFHLLTAILGLSADAPNNMLYLDPVLPKWLPDVNLTGLQVGDCTIDLKFWKEGEATKWNASIAKHASDESKLIKIAQRSWEPW